MEQRRLVAQENLNLNVIQRKIENCPSNVELTQFHKRLIELFDNMNLKAEENRRYVHLYNTVNDTKGLFQREKKYLTDIITHYKACKAKKEKEVLRDNIR